MADFSDDFTAASDVILSSHTPDTGTGWTWNGTNDDGFIVRASDDLLVITLASVPETIGVGFDSISPDLGSADQQIWFRLKSLQSDGRRNTYAAVRVVDVNNFIGYCQFGNASLGNRLSKCVAGTVTDLIQHQGVDETWYRVKAEGNTLSFWRGGTGSEPASPETDTNWTQVGTDQTVTDHNTETTTALVNRGDFEAAALPWIDSFRASAIGGGGGATVPIFHRHYARMKAA